MKMQSNVTLRVFALIVAFASLAGAQQAGGNLGIIVRDKSAKGGWAVFGPQNLWVAVSSGPGLVDIYQTDSKRKLRSFQTSSAGFHSPVSLLTAPVSAHPTRDLLAVGSSKSVVLFDIAAGTKLWEVQLASSVASVAIDAGTESVAACLWDVEDGLPRSRLERLGLATGKQIATSIDPGFGCYLHGSGRWATLAYTKNPQTRDLEAFRRDAVLRIYDLRSQAQFGGDHASSFVQVADNAGKRVLTADMASNGGWRLTDAESGRTIVEEKNGFAMPLGNGKSMLVGSEKSPALRVLDVENGREVGTRENWLTRISSGATSMSAIGLDREGKTIAFMQGDTLQVLPIDRPAPSAAVLPKVEPAPPQTGILPGVPNSVGLSPDGRWLYLRSADNFVDRWDIASGNRAPVRVALPPGTAYIAFDQGGRYLAAMLAPDSSSGGASQQAGMSLWKSHMKRFDLLTGAAVPDIGFRSVQGIHAAGGGYLLELNPRYRMTRKGIEDPKLEVTVREIASRTVAGIVTVSNVLSSLGGTVSGDGNRLALIVLPLPNQKQRNQQGHEIHVYTIGDGKKLLSVPAVARTDWLASTLLLNHDGSRLVTGRGMSGGTDGGIRRWDVNTGREYPQLPESAGRLPFAISLDGKLLLASQPMTVPMTAQSGIIYDLESGKAVTDLAVPSFRNAQFLPGNKAVAMPSEDGMELWSLETGKQIARLYATGKGDWLVTTPKGLFDGTPGGWDRINWVQENSGQIFSGEVYFNEFFRPGLLAHLMRGTQAPPARVISNVDRRQPLVKIRVAGQDEPRTARVQIEVREMRTGADGSGVRDVRLFRNGSLVHKWSGAVAIDTEGSAVLEAKVPLVAGENKLTAYAFNRDNIRSAEAIAKVAGEETLRRKGTVHVLAVGINRYSNSAFDLRYAAADAQAFAVTVKEKMEQRGEYDRVETTVLEDAKATKAAVVEELRRIRNSSKPEDVLMVFFAGHGFAYGDRFVMAAHDLGYDGPAAGVREALPLLVQRGVTDLDLEDALLGIDVARLMLVIDSCQSGQLLESEDSRRGPMNSRGLAQLAYEKGMLVLAAAQAQQAALETSRLGHGYLTYALIEEGLKGANADALPKDGKVSALEWLQYAVARVPQMQDEEMRKADGAGRKLSFQIGVVGETRMLQTPRLFYRNDLAAAEWIVAALR